MMRATTALTPLVACWIALGALAACGPEGPPEDGTYYATDVAEKQAALTWNVFYAQESIPSISGRAFADADTPAHLLNMSVFGWGAAGVAQPVTGWNLGDFTGAVSPSPLSEHQRGVNSGWYGSSGVQMAAIESGCQNHTWSIPQSSYNYRLANCQLKYKWDIADNKRPWTRSTSNFRMSFFAKVPRVYFEGGAVGYVYSSILLRDAQSGRQFWVQPQMYDSRGAPSGEYVGWDAGTQMGYANSIYRWGNAGVSRYCTKHPASYWSTGTPWSDWRWYGFSISRQQLLNIIWDLNSRYGSGLSSDPAAYQLLLATVQNEIYWPQGNGHLGMGAKDLWVFEEY